MANTFKTGLEARVRQWLPVLSLYIFCSLVECADASETIGNKPRNVDLPRSGITPSELALVVNISDPLSVQVADYYRKERGIPAENLIPVAFTPGRRVLPVDEFVRIKRQVDRLTPDAVQAYALAWNAPFRVGCMSITSAFAFGFDPAWCAAGCSTTRLSPYYNSASTRPFAELGVRPTMMLAAQTIDLAQALIDRGVRADGTMPSGKAFLLETSDQNRSVRKVFYPEIERLFGAALQIRVEAADSIKRRNRILFYFTGSTRVADIASNHYLPGAMADHLTSAGGQLFGGSQMSAMRWLEAGATGSYGTVVEPCNYLQKFPNPVLAIHYYLQGNTLLESYWKSVAMPGQGVFIGEPLAQPFRGYQLRSQGRQWLVESPQLRRGDFRVLASTEAQQRYTEVVSKVAVLPSIPGILLPEPTRAYYRIEALPACAQLRSIESSAEHSAEACTADRL